MATMSLPSQAYGVSRKRAQRGPGLVASVRSFFAARRTRAVDDYVQTHLNGRWSDSSERELSNFVLFGDKRGL